MVENTRKYQFQLGHINNGIQTWWSKGLVKGIPRMEDPKLQENSQVVLTEAGLWGLLLGTSQWQQPSDQGRRDKADSATVEIQNILGKFEDVFKDPQGLLPTASMSI